MFDLYRSVNEELTCYPSNVGGGGVVDDTFTFPLPSLWLWVQIQVHPLVGIVNEMIQYYGKLDQ